jgi:hypothetical protein
MSLKPDVDLVPSQSSKTAAHLDVDFDYVHRKTTNRDIYFLRNGSAQRSIHQVTFRAQAAHVELWDAVTGSIIEVPSKKTPDGRTQLEVTLPPFGSIFVVFSAEGSRNDFPPSGPARVLPLENARWQVQFQTGRGAPAEPITVRELESWTDWPQPGVRYFSGTATYRATVNTPTFHQGDEVLLRFKDVREIARVRVNGHDAGTLWAKPLEIRVDPWLHAGSNALEIEVTNLWPNRIIGDLQPGVHERFTRTNIGGYRQNSPLLPSGLIGPVSWIILEKHENDRTRRPSKDSKAL